MVQLGGVGVRGFPTNLVRQCFEVVGLVGDGAVERGGLRRLVRMKTRVGEQSRPEEKRNREVGQGARKVPGSPAADGKIRREPGAFREGEFLEVRTAGTRGELQRGVEPVVGVGAVVEERRGAREAGTSRAGGEDGDQDDRNHEAKCGW